jgi:hypothetical protein
MSVQTSPALPKSCFYEHASTVVPSRKYELRVQPTGTTKFESAGTTCKLTLPQTQNTVFNFQTAYVLFNVTFNYPVGTAGTDYAYLLGSGYSCWARQVIRQSGQVLETIENPGIIQNIVTNMAVNNGDKQAMSNSFGFGTFAPTSGYYNVGQRMNTVANATGFGGTGQSLNQSFAIPLIGLLNCAKMWPAWLGDLDIELTTNALSNYIASMSANSITGFTISNVEFVTECLEFSPESFQQVMRANELASMNQIVIKSQSFTYGSASLTPAQTAGIIDIPFTVRVGSLKGIVWSCSPADAQDGNYGGVNPNLESWQFICNGVTYPQRPVQVKYPAEAFMQNQKSWGAVYSSSHSGSARNTEFAVSSTADPTNASTLYSPYYRPYLAKVANYATVDLDARANKFYQMIDLEKVNGSDASYTGITTNGTSSFIRLNISKTLANVSHAFQYYAYYDLLTIFDLASGQVMVSLG